ncbi:TIGR01457 family HAD-type hydrolase [Carnobacterium sp. ISL-102]|uniref:TIGR01457 family HAD-type hydrolase n=1 Tax=Carnobacterium sp. ISL-102 TaxID=2819142 RepID=UPI001BE67CE9|nr:TIGR01457 family HAD-type hydrolase [Carnobacterium sp. ISL-102]MBT2731981.1 TIGR01457 family HAD-type hydrolase [Carnobacterium sp. ISL-102]
MKYKGYLIDLDGTMYLGKEPIPAASRFIKRLQENKIPYLFVTNNSSKTQKEVADNLIQNFGVQTAEDEVYTSSLATADYLTSLGGGKKVYIIGETGIRSALKNAGFVEDETNPDYVVVGLDRQVTYQDFETATLAIQKGARFIATNKDTNLPSDKGMVPGAGSLVALLIASTRVQPTFIGKPEAIIMEAATKTIGLTKEEVIMVGDNYETDILAGINNDVDTLLVLTGFTSLKDLEHVEQQPTYLLNSLDEWVF